MPAVPGRSLQLTGSQMIAEQLQGVMPRLCRNRIQTMLQWSSALKCLQRTPMGLSIQGARLATYQG